MIKETTRSITTSIRLVLSVLTLLSIFPSIVETQSSTFGVPAIKVTWFRISRKQSGISNGRSTMLTKRQRQVMELLAEGKTRPEIASSLHIGLRTVSTYIEEVREKVDAHTTAQTMAMCFRLELIK